MSTTFDLSALFASGRAVDLIIVVMFIEAAAFLIWRWLSGSGLGSLDVALLLVPGLCILMALRTSLTGGDWTMMAVWLLASFVAHLADVWRRWPRS